MSKHTRHAPGGAPVRRGSSAHTTREHRIYLTWKGVQRCYDYRRGEGYSILYRVAQIWKIPIREVRDIIDAQRM